MCEGPGPCIITPPDTHWMCGQCKYENEDASPICDACDFPRGADLSNADCFVKCPGAGCSQHVAISTSGCVERCLCQCGFLFCSLCLRQFHGIPPGGAAPLAPPKLGSRSASSSSTPNRLYCSGAASISAAWESYKNSKLAPSSTAPCTTKHHVDPSDLLPVAALLKLERMATSEYRLQCGMCSNDVIGLRFSCIHCPGGLELCVDCAVRPDVKHHGGGSGPHAFQIYNGDQNPPDEAATSLRHLLRRQVVREEGPVQLHELRGVPHAAR